jgi:hypothetical protein
MSLSANIKALLSATQSVSGDLGSGDFKAAQSFTQAFTDGAGAGQVDRMFSDTRTLSASANENLDVATGGGLTDAFGAALAMARIKAVFIKAATGNTNNVQFTRPASNGVPLFMAAGDGISLAPGEMFMWVSQNAAGVAVTAATADLLNVANSGAGTSVTYSIVILGAAT